MKYCVSDKVNHKILEQADEIKFAYKDRRVIPDFFEKYPKADIILQIAPFENIDWEQLKLFNTLSQGKLILCLGSIRDLNTARALNFKFYYGYPISSAHEIQPLVDLGVCYIKVGLPLFFDMPTVQELPTRVTVNVAYTDGFPREDGVNGIWIRPEDQDLYAPYINTIEFEDIETDKEELLYRVYAIDKEWRHGLDLLINGLNHEGNNRMIGSDMIKHRLTCRQDCARDKNSCHICWRLLDLADADRIRKYKETVYPSKREEIEE